MISGKLESDLKRIISAYAWNDKIDLYYTNFAFTKIVIRSIDNDLNPVDEYYLNVDSLKEIRFSETCKNADVVFSSADEKINCLHIDYEAGIITNSV
jgi:hypothetical protein